MNAKKNFVWGVATSSYQIEGAVTEGGRGLSIWDTFCMQDGTIQDGTSGKLGCDHYHRLDEDIQLISNLGVNAYRFSIAWPRIYPQGLHDKSRDGIDFYNRLVDGLLQKNIQPWITLYHWDLPQALQDQGGWTHPDCGQWFADYAVGIVSELKDRVSNIILLNEPSVSCFEGHLIGTHAPGFKGKSNFLKAAYQHSRAIHLGYHAVKALDSKLNVGSSFTYFPVRPADEKPEFFAAQDMMDSLWNRLHLDPILKGTYPDLLKDDIAAVIGKPEQVKTPLDFIGLQHYSPSYAYPTQGNDFGATFGPPPEGTPVTDMGWAIDPDAFREGCVDFMDRYGDVPVYITENGCAMPDQINSQGQVSDQRRIEYFESYLASLEDAMDQGVDVRGYFVWSFMDNFEWAFGLAKRFGIIFVDYKNNFKRTPKESYYWWQSKLSALKSVKKAG